MPTVEKLIFVHCPRCGEKTAYTGNPFRPFCSEPCKNIDLANWDDERYAVAGDSIPQDPEDDLL